MKSRLARALGALLCLASVAPAAELWTPVDEAGPKALAARRATSSQLHRLDERALRAQLALAPQEGAAKDGQRLIVTLPAPDGSLQRFAVEESSLMEVELQAKFPDLRTYAGRGVDDPSLTARLDFTEHGFHAQVIGRLGRWLTDPLPEAGAAIYQTYARRAAVPSAAAAAFQCGVSELQQKQMFGQLRAQAQAQPPTTDAGPTGANRRTFRLAVAASKEYTNFTGGTVNSAMSAITTAINRVRGIYETELSVSFTLVANNSSIIYTTANPGPYDGFNNNASALLTRNQTNLDAVIGSANYDIGHVFTTGSGGLAQLGVICDPGFKAQGTTGLSNPTGDSFYVDYVCHEFGHQFGANHTFNSTQGSCGGGNRAATAAYEPGSGTTIMAYSGLCGTDNTQSQVSPVFHAGSFNEITAYLATVSCGTTTNNGGNSPPTVTAPAAGTVIPNNTPFKLTATGSDPNSDALTYSWEEYDLGPAGGLASADNGFSPLFRSLPPSASPIRYFPRLAVVRGDEAADSERLPTYTGATTRTMNFRVTARDNRGGVQQAATSISVATAAGPFRITSQTSSATYAGGSTQTVTWNVAGTTANGINTSQVNIRFSSDNGDTFPTVLASAIPNNGTATVTVPSIDGAKCRFMVEAVGNIFFAVSSASFVVNTTGQAFSARLINVSTRLSVQTGDAVAIGGFVISGTGSKRLIVRGIGPSLTSFGVAGALANPTLELYAGANLLQSNDNWRNTQQTEINASGFAPTGDQESAIIATLTPGSYTAIVRGSGGSTGVGLVEVYDLDGDNPTARLANISTRGRVLAGDSIMIGGFVVNGNTSKRVIIRAIGPSLANFGVTGQLSDPVLTIKNSSGATIAENDDWQNPSSNASAVTASGFAPTNTLESAIVLDLAPGSYTALVAGYDGGVGVGLVEVYELP